MLEAEGYDDNCFVTLTTAPEYGETLKPEDLQKFFRSFRKRIAPRRIRYFAVGEYGGKFGRPHYHAAVFNWPYCVRGVARDGEACSCVACSPVDAAWDFGFVSVRKFERGSAAYVAKYTVKKMTRPDDFRLKGRYPEFARMSLRPGIGADAMWEVASALMVAGSSTPIPTELTGPGGKAPLGRYLRRRLRLLTGREANATEKELQAMAHELRLVREYAFANDRSVSEVYEELNRGWEMKLEAKARKDET